MSTTERSPRSLLYVTSIFLVLAEFCVMGLLAALPAMPPMREALVDGLLLALASLPVLYYFLYLPLARLLEQRRHQEEALRRHRDQLEEMVRERTAELSRKVGEHRVAEESLRQQGELQRQITDSISEALVILDPEGGVVFWNPAAEVLSGYEAAEAQQRGFQELINPAPLAGDPGTVDGLLAGTGPRGHLAELVIRRRDGSERTVECSFSPLSTGGDAMTLVVMRDISERCHAERKREELQRQLRQAQKMEAIGALAGGIAHDFNNILTAILGYADLALAEASAGSTLREDIGNIRTAGLRARELVRQILAFSRQAEQKALPVQPALIAKEVLKLLRASLPSSIEIRQDIDPNGGYVAADPTLIHQILLNLCTNAKHAMGEQGGVLSLRLERCVVTTEPAGPEPCLDAGEYVLLTVGDTGCGMAPEVLERIFDPYFTTKPAGEGTGMGLAVVHGIVANMKGSVLVDSIPGQGTTFRVYMPAIIDAETVAAAHGETPAFVSGSGRILLVDDEESIGRMGKRLLEMLGYQATTCSASLAALELFKANPHGYDLAITDYMMPNMNGLALSAAIKKIRPDLPIVMMTGFGDTNIENEAHRRGVDTLLLKPVMPSELSRIIHDLIAGRQASA